MTHGAASSITVNSWTVIVSKNSDFSSPVSTLTPTFAANTTTTITRPNGVDWSNCYYKFVYNVTVSGDSNKFIQFSEAKFYKEVSGGGTYTVTYNANDGSQSPDIYQVTDTSPHTVLAIDDENIDFTYEGHVFSNWHTTADGTSGTSYTAGNEMPLSADVTLYAQWVATHTVTMPDNDEYGTYTMSSTFNNNEYPATGVPYGATVTLTYTPAEGYEDYVATWIVDEETIYGKTFLMPNDDVTIGVSVKSCVKDEITIDFAEVSSGAYTSWSNKIGASKAVYAGISAGSLNVNPHYIQLNYNNSSGNSYHSGIVTTGSGGKVKKIVVTWATKYSNTNGRILKVYGSNTAYAESGDLYNSSTFGSEIGTLTYNSSNPPTTLDISGEYKYIGLLTSGAMYFDKIEIYWEPSSVATPTFDPDGDTYVGTQNIEIGCATEDATIYYTTDDTTPTAGQTGTSIYSGAKIEISANTTLKARAYKNGEYSAEKSAIYTITQPLTTIPAIFAAATTTPATQYVTFDNWVVTGISTNGHNIFVTDRNGNGFNIHYETNESSSYTVGKQLLGTSISCSLALSNGYAQLIGLDASSLTQTDGTTVAYSDIAMASLAGINTGALVHYENLICSISGGKYYLTDGTTTLQVYNSLYAFGTLNDGKKYNISGVYQQYGETKEILPRSASDIVEVLDPEIVIGGDENVNIAYNDEDAHTAYVTYNNMENPSSDDAEVALYTDAECQTSFTGSWFIADFAKNSVTTIEYASETNATHESRTVYMRVEVLGEEDYLPCNVITITQAAAPTPAIYTYSVNGVEGESSYGFVGDEITLVDGEDMNEDYTFAGWTTNPTDVENRLSGEYTLADEVTTFYAVYLYTTGGESSYVKVTSLNDIEAGEYIIVSDGYYLQNDEVTAKNGFQCDGKTVSVSNDVITDVTDDMLWNFTGTKDNMSIKSGDYTLYCISDNNGMRNTTNNYAGTWSFSDNNNGFSMKYSSVNRYCGIYVTSNVNTNWRSYTSATNTNYADGGQLYLYKKITNSTTTAYYTHVQEISQDYNTIETVNSADLITVPQGVVLTITGSDACTGGPANLIIEDGGELVINNPSANVQATFQKSITTAAAKDDQAVWYTIASPIAEMNITDVTNLVDGEGLYYNLYRYNETVQSSQWEAYNITNHADFTTLESGRGYLYRNNGKPLAFAGEVTTGAVEVTVTNTVASGKLRGFNLIGNPYGHTIYKGKDAAIDNANLADGFYYLKENGTWLPGDYKVAITPNMGILVKLANNEDPTKDRTEKFDIIDTPNKPTQERYGNDNLKFMVSNSEFEDVAYVMFHEGNGLNKINHRNAKAPMLFVPQGGDNYAIAMMNDNTKVFGLGFKAATMGQYTLRYKADGNFNYLHVVDRLTGADVDMLLDGEYTFVAAPGDSESRFIVKLEYMPNYSEGDSEMFAYQCGSEILVSGSGELQIFDITGRKVITSTINGAEAVRIPAQGVYILKLNDKIQKIVVR